MATCEAASTEAKRPSLHVTPLRVEEASASGDGGAHARGAGSQIRDNTHLVNDQGSHASGTASMGLPVLQLADEPDVRPQLRAGAAGKRRSSLSAKPQAPPVRQQQLRRSSVGARPSNAARRRSSQGGVSVAFGRTVDSSPARAAVRDTAALEPGTGAGPRASQGLHFQHDKQGRLAAAKQGPKQLEQPKWVGPLGGRSRAPSAAAPRDDILSQSAARWPAAARASTGASHLAAALSHGPSQAAIGPADAEAEQQHPKDPAGRLHLDRLQQQGGAAGSEPSTPPLRRRERSSELEAPQRCDAAAAPGAVLSAESSLCSVGSDVSGVAAAARCITFLPLRRLSSAVDEEEVEEEEGAAGSPPRHRRAPPSPEPLTPRGSGGGGARASAQCGDERRDQDRERGEQQQQGHQRDGGPQAPPLKSRAAAAAHAAAAGSPAGAARVVVAGVRQRAPAPDGNCRTPPRGAGDSSVKVKARRTAVPRLDLTPVLRSQEMDQGDSSAQGADADDASSLQPFYQQQPQQQPEQHQWPGWGGAGGGAAAAAAAAAEVPLPGAPGNADDTGDDGAVGDLSDVEDYPDTRQQQQHRPLAAAAGDKVSAGASSSSTGSKGASKAGRAGGGGGGRSGAGGKASGKSGGKVGAACGGAPKEEDPPEAFYVYAPAVPAEEARSFESIKRALRLRGQPHLVSEVEELWERYTEARRNCEAMAFRGHRLLDQVTNEFGGYKRDAEEKMEQLGTELSEWKEQADMALAVVPASGLQLAQQADIIGQQAAHIAVLEEQVQHLIMQLHRDPSELTDEERARLIAGSATANILLKKVCQQEMQLSAGAKLTQDLKAALLLVCGVLKQTSYVRPDDPVRNSLPPQMVHMIDMMLSSAQVEEMLAEQVDSYTLLGGSAAGVGRIEGGGSPGAGGGNPTPGKWMAGVAGGGASCVIEERGPSAMASPASRASGRGSVGGSPGGFRAASASPAGLSSRARPAPVPFEARASERGAAGGVAAGGKARSGREGAVCAAGAGSEDVAEQGDQGR